MASDLRSDLGPAGAQLGQDHVDALLVDGTQRRLAHPQAHPTVLVLHPETAALQIGQKPALGPVVRVGNVVPRHRPLAGYLAHPCHDARSEFGKTGFIPRARCAPQGLPWRGPAEPAPGRTRGNPYPTIL